ATPDTCSSILIISGDTCSSLAARCGITTTQLAEYNTDICSSSLTDGEAICCSAGTLNLPPQQSSDGLCYTHVIQYGDTCARLADAYSISTEDIEAYNNDTFGWTSCDDIRTGSFLCLSAGSPPMPVAISNYICGPQVTGTPRPDNISDIASLNPCVAQNCKPSTTSQSTMNSSSTTHSTFTTQSTWTTVNCAFNFYRSLDFKRKQAIDYGLDSHHPVDFEYKQDIIHKRFNYTFDSNQQVLNESFYYHKQDHNNDKVNLGSNRFPLDHSGLRQKSM
ncbi:glycoside hydrolase family 18 protein, partial [Penicillium verhagenii]|uniref:glycoside hydrolase family 18 protein n=1 Tax=Penicillium verhagenii TaxID=1562060 RepID=UPI0025452CEF